MIDRVVGVLEHHPLPFGIGLHVGVGRAADDQLQRLVERAQRLGDFVGEPAVFVRGLVADLPGPVHLVAETPMLDAERLGATVGLAQIAPIAARRAVDVFDEIARLIEPARAEVDGEHHFGSDLCAPGGEFVQADGVGFRGVPGEIEPRRPLLARTDAVLPIVGGDEIAAGITHDGNLEIPHEFDDVAAHAVRVGGRMAGLVDAGVNRAPEMLEERAVEAVVDARDREVPWATTDAFMFPLLGASRSSIRISDCIGAHLRVRRQARQALFVRPQPSAGARLTRIQAIPATISLARGSGDCSEHRSFADLLRTGKIR